MRLRSAFRCPLAAVGLAMGLAAPASARAEPQATAGLTLGFAGEGSAQRPWYKTTFHLGVHSDVMFGRSSNADFGIGPYVEVLTHGFNEIQFGGGLSGLLPVFDALPIVLSAGGYGRKAEGPYGVEPGLTGQLFFGSRSYNFHANYVMTGGLLAEVRYGLGASRETSFVVSGVADFVVLSLPVVFLVNAIRGGGPETDPVRR